MDMQKIIGTLLEVLLIVGLTFLVTTIVVVLRSIRRDENGKR